MTRRKLLLALALVALALVAVLAYVRLTEDRVTFSAYRQLKEGMTLDEVKRVLGAPSECLDGMWIWRGRTGFIEAWFDSEEKLKQKIWTERSGGFDG